MGDKYKPFWKQNTFLAGSRFDPYTGKMVDIFNDEAMYYLGLQNFLWEVEDEPPNKGDKEEDS